MLKFRLFLSVAVCPAESGVRVTAQYSLEPAVAKAIDIERTTAQQVRISHINSTGAGNSGKGTVILRTVDSVNASGERVSFDVYP